MPNPADVIRLARELEADAAELRGPLVDALWDRLPLACLIVGIPAWLRAERQLKNATKAIRQKTARLRAMTAELSQ